MLAMTILRLSMAIFIEYRLPRKIVIFYTQSKSSLMRYVNAPLLRLCLCHFGRENLVRGIHLYRF